MKHSDFAINKNFKCGGNVWKCTDIGTRTITAIKLAQEDESWYEGPPYAVAEQVFDENDIGGCEAQLEGLQ